MAEQRVPAGGDFPDDLARLWFLVRRLGGLMDRAGDALYRQGIGISLAQFLVLSVVDAYPGPVKQQAIADRLGLTKGTVSRQIDQAVAAGLMTSSVSETSRRENALRLTAKGEEFVRRGDALQQSLADGLPDYTPDDLAATIRVLTAFTEAYER